MVIFFFTDHGLYVKYNEVDIVVSISLMLTIYIVHK